MWPTAAASQVSQRDLDSSVLNESQQIKEQIQSESTDVKIRTLYLMLLGINVLGCWTPVKENCFMKTRKGTGASLKQKGDQYEAEKLYRPECTWRLNHITKQKLQRENLHDSAHGTPATLGFHLMLKWHLAVVQNTIHVTNLGQ